MKKIFLLYILFHSFSAISQVFTIENHAGDPVKNAKFYGEKSEKIVFSNPKGRVNLTGFFDDELIYISHINCEELKIVKSNVQDFNIILIQKNIQLSEVKIHSSLNVETNNTQIIRLKTNDIKESLGTNTADVLSKSASITIQKSQSGGGSPNIRGFEANKLLLVVDDVVLNNTMYRSGHLQNILSVDPFIVNEISVLHGPSSVFYGSGALGGAIVINTLNPKLFDNEQHVFLQQFESANNSVLAHFHSIFHYKNSSSLSSISIKKYGNIIMGNRRLHGYENWGKYEFATNGSEQLFGEYHQIDITQKTCFKINRDDDLICNTQFSTTSNIHRFDKLNDIENGHQKYSSWYYGPQKRLLHSWSYSSKSRTYLFNSSSIALSYQNIGESRHKKNLDEIFFTRRFEDLNILDIKLNMKKRFVQTSINYGGDIRYQNLKSSAFTQIGSIGEKQESTTRYPDKSNNVIDYSLFLQGEYFFKKTTWYNGLRYNIHKLSSSFGENTLAELPNDEINLENKNLTFSSNLTHKINNRNFISSSIYSGYRNPNVDDVGKVFSKNSESVVVPNSSLQSEKILSSELMYKYNFSEKSFLKIALYYTILTDAIEKRKFQFNGLDSIVYDGEMMGTIANVNIKKATIQGYNLSFKTSLSHNLNLSIISNFCKGISSDSLPLSHIPPLSLYCETEYLANKKSKFKFYIHYNDWKSSENFDLNGVDNLEEATEDGTPAWYTLNILYNCKINSKLNFSIGCENLLDIHYKTFASAISSPGRNLIVNLQSVF